MAGQAMPHELKKRIGPFEEDTPSIEPLFINCAQAALLGDDFYLDVGVVTLESADAKAGTGTQRVCCDKSIGDGQTNRLSRIKLKAWAPSSHDLRLRTLWIFAMAMTLAFLISMDYELAFRPSPLFFQFRNTNSIDRNHS